MVLENMENIDFCLLFYYYGILRAWIVQTLKVKGSGTDFRQGNYSLRIVSGDHPAFFQLSYRGVFPEVKARDE
jgi:hypothetical protein